MFQPNMLEKQVLMAFPQDLVINFLIFAQRCVLAMLKTWPSPIFEKKLFFRPEICWKSPFLQIFFGLFPHILLFFFTQKLKWYRFYVRSLARSQRSFVLSLAGRSNQHVACSLSKILSLFQLAISMNSSQYIQAILTSIIYVYL